MWNILFLISLDIILTTLQYYFYFRQPVAGNHTRYWQDTNVYTGVQQQKVEHGLQIGDPKKIGKNSNIFDSFTSKFLPLDKAKAFYFISSNTVVSSIMTETLDLNYSQQLTSLIPDQKKNTELIDTIWHKKTPSWVEEYKNSPVHYNYYQAQLNNESPSTRNKILFRGNTQFTASLDHNFCQK